MNIKAATIQYNMKEEEWLKNQEKRRINPRERERERIVRFWEHGQFSI